MAPAPSGSEPLGEVSAALWVKPGLPPPLQAPPTSPRVCKSFRVGVPGSVRPRPRCHQELMAPTWALCSRGTPKLRFPRGRRALAEASPNRRRGGWGSRGSAGRRTPPSSCPRSWGRWAPRRRRAAGTPPRCLRAGAVSVAGVRDASLVPHGAGQRRRPRFQGT